MAAGDHAIPYSASTLIALQAEHFTAIQRTVALLFRLAHSPAYQALIDADADPLLRRSRVRNRPAGRLRPWADARTAPHRPARE